jgi:hypothetical protein
MLNELANTACDNTEIVLLNLEHPITDKVDPKRAQLRKEKVEPKFTNSNVELMPPRRNADRTERLEPRAR